MIFLYSSSPTDLPAFNRGVGFSVIVPSSSLTSKGTLLYAKF